MKTLTTILILMTAALTFGQQPKQVIIINENEILLREQLRKQMIEQQYQYDRMLQLLERQQRLIERQQPLYPNLYRDLY